MTRRHLVHRLALAVLLGVLANIVIAFGLAWSPRVPAPGSGILFLVSHEGSGVIVSVTPVASFGRDSVCVGVGSTVIGSLVTGSLSLQELRDRAADIRRDPWYQAADRDHWTWSPAYFPDWSASAAAVSSSDPKRRAFAAGFPFRCFYGTASLARPSREGLLAIDPGNPVRAIPIRPIPWNLAANSSLYALAWGFLLLGIPVLRRRVRSCRGHCPACGYDLRRDSAAGCPECGWNRLPTPET